MGRYPDSDIAAVRQAADIIALVGEYTPVKRTGSAHKALCLFHDEKTPSMTLTADSDGGRFYCFGCGENGDAIDFVRKIDGLTFPEAVGVLADRFGVTLHQEETSAATDSRSDRASIVETNEAAAAFFGQSLLADEEAEPARALLIARGFDVEQCVAEFGCGYAPRKATALPRHLQRSKFTAENILAAELAVQIERGALLSRFTGRLVWAIRNPFGKAIGFGARRLYDDDRLPSKFVNTTETPVYKKSHVLYGLDRARREIVKSGQAVVVEGYTDVMACHLAGVGNAIATCGTAFTSDHLTILRRLVGDSGEVVFGFDDDTAGRSASLKVYDLAQGALHRLSALPPADGLDPDEYRQAHGDEALRRMVQQRRPLIETVLLTTLDLSALDTPEDRRTALDKVLPLLEHLRDPLLREEYVGLVARKLGFNPNVVSAQIATPLPRAAKSKTQTSSTAPQQQSQTPGWLERDALHLLVLDRSLAEQHLTQVQALLTRPAAQGIALAVSQALADPDHAARSWPLLVLDQTEGTVKEALGPLVGSPPPVPPDQADGHLREIIARLQEVRAVEAEAQLRHDMENAATPEDRDRLFGDLLLLRSRR